MSKTRQTGFPWARCHSEISLFLWLYLKFISDMKYLLCLYPCVYNISMSMFIEVYSDYVIFTFMFVYIYIRTYIYIYIRNV